MSIDTERRPPLLQKMADNRERTSYLLFAAAALLGIIPLWLLLKYRTDYLGVSLSTMLLALVPAAAAFWNLLRLPGREREVDIARSLVLVVGGLCGLLLVMTSGLLVYHWWDAFNGLKTIQGSEGWRVWAALIVLLGGLAGMFAALQVVRSEERASATLRRLVYGYNALLTGVLLLAVLSVVNVLAYANLNKPYDWTSQSIYSLSSKSENILAGLTKPTKIYVILAHGVEVQRLVQALLDNCQAVNRRIEVTYLSPELNRERVKSLAEQFKFGERDGLLVVYGTPPQEQSQFISARTLFTGSRSSFSQNTDTRFFKGESELLSTLSFLAAGKQQPVVYFMQGNGELDINDAFSREPNKGMGQLKRRLQEGNYTVKGLRLSEVEAPSPAADVAVATQVPADATVIVIAGPKQRLPKYTLDALQKFMEPTGDAAKPKGKLVVLFDQALTAEKDQLVQTGLEEFLDRYNVQVNKDRVLSRSTTPLLVLGGTDPTGSGSRNKLVGTFKDDPFGFYDTRTIVPKTTSKPEENRYKAESFMYVWDPVPLWVETDFRTPLEDWLKRDKLDEIRKKAATKALSIGVTVAEEDARGPHATEPVEEKPRLVVLGTITPANIGIRGSPQIFGRQYDLFQSILGWLGDRPADIGIEAKKQDVYVIGPRTNFDRMLYLPIFLMVFGVAGLGAAVWVVRRK